MNILIPIGIFSWLLLQVKNNIENKLTVNQFNIFPNSITSYIFFISSFFFKIGQQFDFFRGKTGCLRFAYLSYLDFSKVNLMYANLSNANLEHAYLREANLSYANLNNTNLSYADLEDTYLEYSDLTDAKLKNVNLEGAELKGTILEKKEKD